MPEGDTLARTAATMHRWLAGREITAAATKVDGFPADRLVGRQVESVDAWGKNLMIRLDGDQVVHTHMRMTGSWHVYPAGQPWRRPERQARLTLTCGDRVAVCFNAPVVKLLRPGAERRHPGPRQPGARRPGRARRRRGVSPPGPGRAPRTAPRRAAPRPAGGVRHRQHLALRGPVRRGPQPVDAPCPPSRTSSLTPWWLPPAGSCGPASTPARGCPTGAGSTAGRAAVPPVPHAGAVPQPGRPGPHRLLVPDLPAGARP